MATGTLEEAIASYHRTLAVNSAYAEAHINLGNTLKSLGKQDEAESALAP